MRAIFVLPVSHCGRLRVVVFSGVVPPAPLRRLDRAAPVPGSPAAAPGRQLAVNPSPCCCCCCGRRRQGAGCGWHRRQGCLKMASSRRSSVACFLCSAFLTDVSRQCRSEGGNQRDKRRRQWGSNVYYAWLRTASATGVAPLARGTAPLATQPTLASRAATVIFVPLVSHCQGRRRQCKLAWRGASESGVPRFAGWGKPPCTALVCGARDGGANLLVVANGWTRSSSETDLTRPSKPPLGVVDGVLFTDDFLYRATVLEMFVCSASCQRQPPPKLWQ